MKKQIRYLRKLTNNFGITQFSNNSNPDIKSGYTLDDVSRALIVSSKLNLSDLSEIYLNFIRNAQLRDGRFINVYSEYQMPLEKIGSEDSFGRTIWALGEYLCKNEKNAKDISYKTLHALGDFGMHWPISESFALLGLTKMNELGFENKKTGNLIEKLSNSLIKRIKKHSNKKNWTWTSDEMSYENSRIPQALFRAHNSLESKDYLYYAEKLTDFLDKHTLKKKEEELILNVIGNNTSGLKGNWFRKTDSQNGKNPPIYDEQPVDAGGMVELHAEAYGIKNKDKYYLQIAKTSLDWFNGKNRLNKKMISDKGGIYDGLNKDFVNPNQGAESLLSYMMAKLKLREIENGI